MSDLQPHDVMRESGRWFPVVVVIGILASVAIVLVVLSTQKLWFFADTQNAKHQVTIQQISASAYQDNPGSQASWISQGEQAFQQASDAGAGTANAAGDARQACEAFAKVNIIPAGDKSLVTQNCNGPVLSPNSPYYVP